MSSIELGMRNHEWVPAEVIARISRLRGGETYKVLVKLLKNKFVVHTGKNCTIFIIQTTATNWPTSATTTSPSRLSSSAAFSKTSSLKLESAKNPIFTSALLLKAKWSFLNSLDSAVTLSAALKETESTLVTGPTTTGSTFHVFHPSASSSLCNFCMKTTLLLPGPLIPTAMQLSCHWLMVLHCAMFKESEPKNKSKVSSKRPWQWWSTLLKMGWFTETTTSST